MKVAIVGLGLIGGSLGLDLKKNGFASRLLGVDSNPMHADQALRFGLVDEIVSIEEAGSADLLALSIPVDGIARILPGILDRVKPGTTVFDLGSTKEKIGLAVSAHPKRLQFVPTHPMAGTENSGPEAAFHGLFTGKTVVLCDVEKSGGTHLERVLALYASLGMRVVRMKSDEHDLHAAYVSHLSHISSFVLANTVLEKEKDAGAIFDLAGSGFESAVRLAKSSPEMWEPIFAENLEPVLASLDAYLVHLEAFRDSLRERRFADTRKLMKNANAIRQVLSALGKRVSGALK